MREARCNIVLGSICFLVEYKKQKNLVFSIHLKVTC